MCLCKFIRCEEGYGKRNEDVGDSERGEEKVVEKGIIMTFLFPWPHLLQEMKRVTARQTFWRLLPVLTVSNNGK
jgi:hypothetical protein